MSTIEKPKAKLITKFGNVLLKIAIGIVSLPTSKWVWVVILLLFLHGPFIVIWISITNPTYDITPITNIAFALLAGIASVSFSWARSIEQDDKRLVRSIVYGGELAFLSALFFLLASGFKYFFLNSFGAEVMSRLHFLAYIVIGMSVILFTVACMSFLFAISQLFYVLRIRIELGDNLPSDFIKRL